MNKSTFSILLSLCFIVLFSACKGGSETNDASQTIKKPIASQVKMIPIELNNGAKWKVDASTNLAIGEIKSSLSEISVTASNEQYQAWLENFKVAIEQASASSALDGDTKLQFANFLKNAEQIGQHLNSSDVFTRQDATEELKKVMDTYSDYFE